MIRCAHVGGICKSGLSEYELILMFNLGRMRKGWISLHKLNHMFILQILFIPESFLSMLAPMIQLNDSPNYSYCTKTMLSSRFRGGVCV